MNKFPILDNHLHLRPNGRNVDAIFDFQKAGGTHIILSHLPYPGYRITKSNDFSVQYEITLKLAKLVMERTSVKVFVTLGPYPVELLRLSEHLGIDSGKEIMLKGMELAAEYVREGKAIALGEIGRPHFPVQDDILKASNEIMRYGMELAKDVGCAVVLHTESASSKVFEELAYMADSVSLAREKVVKHYSPPFVDKNENLGLIPSVLATEKAIEEALLKSTRFLMETDYLDDPKRPGAVLGIKTVPKRTKAFVEKGLMKEEDVWQIHKENPERIYNIEIG